jgi:hypothetical protein
MYQWYTLFEITFTFNVISILEQQINDSIYIYINQKYHEFKFMDTNFHGLYVIKNIFVDNNFFLNLYFPINEN